MGAHNRQILVLALYTELPGFHFSQHEFTNVWIANVDESNSRHGLVFALFHPIPTMSDAECCAQFRKITCHEIAHCFNAFFQRNIVGKFLDCELGERTVNTLLPFLKLRNYCF